MIQESEVYLLERKDFENLSVHYKSVFILLIRKGKVRIIEGES